MLVLRQHKRINEFRNIVNYFDLTIITLSWLSDCIRQSSINNVAHKSRLISGVPKSAKVYLVLDILWKFSSKQRWRIDRTVYYHSYSNKCIHHFFKFIFYIKPLKVVSLVKIPIYMNLIRWSLCAILFLFLLLWGNLAKLKISSLI